MKNNVIKIGYMGISGSFSEEATKRICDGVNFNKTYTVELLSLVSAKNVIDALNNNEIDYGVVATKNSTAGEVYETKEALKYINYNIFCEYDLPIHHCLFIRSNQDIRNIRKIISHEQALKQTEINRKKLLGDIEVEEVEDTALAAKKIYECNSIIDTAVICSKSAGMLYNLKLVYENIEDKSDNSTHFIMINKIKN